MFEWAEQEDAEVTDDRRETSLGLVDSLHFIVTI